MLWLRASIWAKIWGTDHWTTVYIRSLRSAQYRITKTTTTHNRITVHTDVAALGWWQDIDSNEVLSLHALIMSFIQICDTESGMGEKIHIQWNSDISDSAILDIRIYRIKISVPIVQNNRFFRISDITNKLSPQRSDISEFEVQNLGETCPPST